MKVGRWKVGNFDLKMIPTKQKDTNPLTKMPPFEMGNTQKHFVKANKLVKTTTHKIKKTQKIDPLITISAKTKTPVLIRFFDSLLKKKDTTFTPFSMRKIGLLVLKKKEWVKQDQEKRKIPINFFIYLFAYLY